jgi:hypothetical protein
MTVNKNMASSTTVRGGRKTIIGDIAHASPKTRFDNSLAKALARAYRWKQRLEDGTYATIGEWCKAERINDSYVTRILRLNLLAPDIVEAALDGRTGLTVQALSVPISPIWSYQRSSLDKAAF